MHSFKVQRRASVDGSYCACGTTMCSLFSSTISCMLVLMNSLNESSCCRTNPLSAKNADMTAQASSWLISACETQPAGGAVSA